MTLACKEPKSVQGVPFSLALRPHFLCHPGIERSVTSCYNGSCNAVCLFVLFVVSLQSESNMKETPRPRQSC